MEKFFIDADITVAKTIDTAVYTDVHYFDLARKRIFSGAWHFVGDKDRVGSHGSAFPFTLLENYLDEPLLLTNNNGEINCMSNVCTHRGNLLVYEPCKLKQLTCKYHGRRFSLEGKFISMPEFREVKNFPTEADHLHKLPLYQWGNFLFANLENELKAEDVFGEISERLNWLPMDDLVFDHELSKDYHVKANWALYVENYLEGFHIPFVHAGLNTVLDFGAYTTELFKNSSLQIGIGKEGDSCFDPPPSSPDHGKRVAGYYFWAFPNLMLNFYPWGLSVNVVEPLNVNETRVSFYTYVRDRSKMNIGAGSGLDEVQMEDEDVVEHVQKGIRSRFYTHGRYSVTREQGTHHFHSLLANALNG